MPFGDGTGPLGLGPMTGRAAGYCAGYPVPGFMNPLPGRFFWGFGRGFFGRGRGFRRWYYLTGLPGWYRYYMGLPAWGGWINPYFGFPFTATVSDPSSEKEFLKKQAELLEEELKAIREEISRLEKTIKEEK